MTVFLSFRRVTERRVSLALMLTFTFHFATAAL
jgi:hypothetical protein